jgi:hypothetical protein
MRPACRPLGSFVHKLAAMMEGSDLGRAVGLRRDTLLTWLQDVTFACNIFVQGFRHCSDTLVTLHQSFPDAVSVPRVVGSLAELMDRVVRIMQEELPAPNDPRRGQLFATAQLLLEFEEVCKSKEASEGILMSLERKMWALQEVWGSHWGCDPSCGVLCCFGRMTRLGVCQTVGAGR